MLQPLHPVLLRRTVCRTRAKCLTGCLLLVEHEHVPGDLFRRRPDHQAGSLVFDECLSQLGVLGPFIGVPTPNINGMPDRESQKPDTPLFMRGYQVTQTPISDDISGDGIV